MELCFPSSKFWARAAAVANAVPFSVFLRKYAIAPQRFPKTSWEKSYQQWHFNQLAQWKSWMYVVLIAAFVGLLSNFLTFSIQDGDADILATVHMCAVSSIVCLLYFFTMESIWQAICITSQTRGTHNVRDAQIKSVRLLSLTIAFELLFAVNSEAKTVELALRWFATCPLAFASFEESSAWFLLVLGLRPVYVALHNNLSESRADQLLAGLTIFGISAMAYVVQAKRCEWMRVLASTSILNASFMPKDPPKKRNVPQDGSGSATVTYHDDYFEEEEWALLSAEAEAEGAAMLKRSAYGRGGAGRKKGLTPYEWIHSDTMLGRGAYGRVVVVQSSVTRELCALKRVRVSSSASARRGAGQTEGAILQMLKHPNVVGFVDELEFEGELQLVMELCEGGSLAGLIRNCGPLGDGASRWFTLCLVRALKYLHQQGISHHDVKPENCLLTVADGGEVALKLADFGLSCFKQAWKGKVCGTVAYLAPEALRNAHVTSRRRMDIWSLGVCVLEMVTGKPLELGAAGAREGGRLGAGGVPASEPEEEEEESGAPLSPARTGSGSATGRPEPLGPLQVQAAAPSHALPPSPSRRRPAVPPDTVAAEQPAPESEQPEQHPHQRHIAQLKQLRRDPPLPFRGGGAGPPPPHAAFIRACLRLDPALRPTAHALEQHPFLHSTSCPVDDAVMEVVRGRRRVEWEEISPLTTYRKLLPRVRRSAQFWLSAGAVWQHLLQLEQPFESPALEQKFRQFSTRQRLTTVQQFARVFVPLIRLPRMRRDIPLWINNPLSHLPDMALVVLGQMLIWSSSASMIRNDEAWTNLLRLIGIVHLFTKPLPLAFAPFHHLLTLAACSVMPLSAEGIVNSLAVTLLTVVKRILMLLDTDAQEAQSLHDGGTAGPEKLEKGVGFWSAAFSIVSIHAACEGMVMIALVWRRRRERTRFRDEIVRLSEAPSPGAEQAQAGGGLAGGGGSTE